MVEALADRLAEAFAECLHQRARRDWGYGRDEGLSQRRPDRREIPRHPPGRRLSGLPRPHREGDAVEPAGRRAGHRHPPDRELRHVPGRLRQRPLLRPSPGPLLRRRHDHQRPGGELRGDARSSPSPPSSAGWRRTWRTSRSDLTASRHPGLVTRSDRRRFD